MSTSYKSGTLLKQALLVITVLAAAGLMVSDFSKDIDPITFWPAAFAGLAFVPLFFINLALLIIHAVRRKAIALLPLVVILAGWKVVRGTFSLQSAANVESKPANATRILTWNVHYFENVDNSPIPQTQKKMAALAASLNPDVVCMQEFYTVDPDVKRGVDSMKLALNTRFAYLKTLEDPLRGIAVFSRYPIIRVIFIPLSAPSSGNHCLAADIKKDGKMMRVYIVHLESIKLGEGQLSYINALVKGKEKDIKPSRQIAGQLKHAFLKRSKQVKLIKRLAATCPYPYIICGDFNDPPSSFAFNQMAEGMKSTFKEKGTGFFPVTYYKGFLKYQIDHILVSPQFEVLSHHVIRKKISDHYPVLADLQLN